MSKKYPVTPAIRFLRTHCIDFVPYEYDYVEHGGTVHSARSLGVDEHSVIKTIILRDDKRQGMIVLMHGDCEISTRNLARHIGAKHIEPATPKTAHKLTGYLVGGTSPFGSKTVLPVYAEAGIAALDKIYINGGKRGFLVEIAAHDLAVLNPEWVNVAVTS